MPVDDVPAGYPNVDHVEHVHPATRRVDGASAVLLASPTTPPPTASHHGRIVMSAAAS
jgi:hypothetical protein